MLCATHPKVETDLSCGRCEKAICAKCLVHAPVGIRCRSCAPSRPVMARRGIGLLGGAAIAIVVIVIVASLAGGGTSSSGVPDDYEQYLNEFEGLQGQATANELLDPWKAASADEQPSPGHRYVAIEVTIENNTNDAVPVYVSHSLFKLTDSENFAYSPTPSRAKPQLPEGLELAPGQKTRGWVTFEVDESSQIESLEYWSTEVELPAR